MCPRRHHDILRQAPRVKRLGLVLQHRQECEVLSGSHEVSSRGHAIAIRFLSIASASWPGFSIASDDRILSNTLEYFLCSGTLAA